MDRLREAEVAETDWPSNTKEANPQSAKNNNNKMGEVTPLAKEAI